MLRGVRLTNTCNSWPQITRKIKRVLQKAVVEHAVAERKTWAKFGQEKGNKAGPDRATTTVGENVALKLSAGNKVCLLSSLPPRFRLNDRLLPQSNEPEPTDEHIVKQNLAKAGAGKVTCRLCKGDHFTAKCPYKDSLAGLDGAGMNSRSLLARLC